MADDETDGPTRPVSRGPRVVTGDMVGKARGPRVVTGPGVAPPPADDPPAAAETLVAPAAPAPAAYEPKRSQVVTGRTTLSVGARAAQIAAEGGPEESGSVKSGPVEAGPVGATQTTPPPRHRTPAPPSAPSTKPGKPPKPPKPAKASKPPKAPTPAKPARTPSAGGRKEGRAAFLLALVSLVLAAIPAIPALVLARRARRRIAAEPGASGSGLVTAARIVALFSLAAWLTVAGVVLAKVVSPDGVDYAKLKAGDCIDTPEGTEVRRLTIRDCTEAHDAEVFAVVIHPAAAGDAFPGTDALLSFAANICLGDPFTAYVGVPRGQSQLTEFEIVPEADAWAEGRRGLVCAVDNADRSPLTASVKGSAL